MHFSILKLVSMTPCISQLLRFFLIFSYVVPFKLRENILCTNASFIIKFLIYVASNARKTLVYQHQVKSTVLSRMNPWFTINVNVSGVFHYCQREFHQVLVDPNKGFVRFYKLFICYIKPLRSNHNQNFKIVF